MMKKLYVTGYVFMSVLLLLGCGALIDNVIGDTGEQAKTDQKDTSQTKKTKKIN